MRNLRKGKRVDELRAIEQQLAQARAALVLSTSELKRNETLVAQGFHVTRSTSTNCAAARDRDTARVAELQAHLAVGARRRAARRDRGGRGRATGRGE